jgi:hypothetical protein
MRPVFRLTIRHDVIDYETWKAMFEAWFATGGPAGEGVRDHTFFRDATDPNNVTVLFDFDDELTARAFITNPEHRQVLDRNGVKQSGLLMSVTEL